jgi:phosphoribosyl 1,2-cyclic phosphodiesterase
MKLRFWGVRGSLPTPGPTTLRYGGNTPCYEVRGKQGEWIILDAGTGIRPLGLEMMKCPKPWPPLYLLISHTHWDHIQGFPFFVPAYIPGTDLRIIGPRQLKEIETMRSIFDLMMKYEYFPVSNQQLAAKIDFQSLGETRFEAGGIGVQTQFSNHPVLGLIYRLTEGGRVLVYTGDHEPYYNVFGEKKATAEDDALFGDVDATVKDTNRRFVEFVRKANVLLMDCTYTPEEYRANRKGWGHSAWDYCLQCMKEAEVERLVLTHHDPTRSDDALDEILKTIRAAASQQGIDPAQVTLATEGAEVEV